MVQHGGLIVSTLSNDLYQIIKDQGSYARDDFDVCTESFKPRVGRICEETHLSNLRWRI